jgi:hypothetical protein
MLINILIFVLPLFLNAVANPVSVQSHSLTPRDNSGVSVTILTNPDGTYELTFSENGVTQGYLVETTPNSTYSYYFIALDASGLPIDPTALLNGAVSNVLQLEVELASLAQQFGKAVWNFIACIGMEVYVNCLGYAGTCLRSISPVNCAALIACAVANGATNIELCINGATSS